MPMVLDMDATNGRPHGPMRLPGRGSQPCAASVRLLPWHRGLGARPAHLPPFVLQPLLSTGARISRFPVRPQFSTYLECCPIRQRPCAVPPLSREACMRGPEESDSVEPLTALAQGRTASVMIG